MLKIKDSVGLKELKKFGFEYLKFDRIYEFGVDASIIQVKRDRKIRLVGDIFDYKQGDMYIDLIYSLIKADLVEKAGNDGN